MARKKNAAQPELVVQEESTALALLPPEQRAKNILKFDAIKTRLTELAKESVRITEIRDKVSYEQCHSARMNVRNQRIAIEKTAKAAREDANAFSKAVIAAEKDLIGIISTEEDRLESLQKAYDDEVEKQRAEKARIAMERYRKEQAFLKEIRETPMVAFGGSSETVGHIIDELDKIDMEALSESIRDEAREAFAEAMSKLTEMLRSKKVAEEESKKLAEERAALDKQREEQEAKRRENEEGEKGLERIRRIPSSAINMSSHHTEGVLQSVREMPLNNIVPPSFLDRAQTEIDAAIAFLTQMIEDKRQHEAAAKKLADDRAALEKAQQEQREREAAEEKKKRDAQEAADKAAAAARAEKERKEKEASDAEAYAKLIESTPPLLQISEQVRDFLFEKGYEHEPLVIQFDYRIIKEKANENGN